MIVNISPHILPHFSYIPFSMPSKYFFSGLALIIIWIIKQKEAGNDPDQTTKNGFRFCNGAVFNEPEHIRFHPSSFKTVLIITFFLIGSAFGAHTGTAALIRRS